MKQVININFQGRIVPIEVTAYEILKQYIDSLTRHFDSEEGKEEIINDIESRIGELFQERLKAGATCIIDDDVNAIIKSIGRPEEFDDKSEANTSGYQKADEQNNNYTNSNTRKRLFRDENHKLVGGVCSGIANYFDIDIAIVRIVFAILLLSFGIGFIPYIIFWIAVPSSAATVIGSRRKKLYRDIDDKYIGGVASGLAHYFGISTWIPRVIFLLPLLGLLSHSWRQFGYSFGHNLFNLTPGPFFIYIILWIVLPEAKTTAEKLEMKGEKIDINSIKESVSEEIKGVQQRVKKFASEATVAATQSSKTFSREAQGVMSRNRGTFGNIITVLVKVFVYSILGIVGISLVIALFAVGIFSINAFPQLDFIFTGGIQNWLAWGTLIFFIVVPMIGVITWIVRKVARIKTGSKMIRLGFIAMWLVGLVCLICLQYNLSKDFSYTADLPIEQIAINNSGLNSLEVTNLNNGVGLRRRNWFRNNDIFENLSNDTATIRNVMINIAKSTNDSFKVEVNKYADGKKQLFADSLASLIKFNVVQKDSTLIIDKGIGINTKNKFRNQFVAITIYVPVGKKIKVQENLGWLTQLRFHWFSVEGNNYSDIRFENIEKDWQPGVWYIMTKDGLVTLDGKPANSYRKSNEDNTDDNADESGTYRYDSAAIPKTSTDSILMNLKKQERKIKDSLEDQKRRIDKQLEKFTSNQESVIKTLITPSNILGAVLR